MLGTSLAKGCMVKLESDLEELLSAFLVVVVAVSVLLLLMLESLGEILGALMYPV